MIDESSSVIVSLAPSFIANYDGVGIEQMTKALKELGFSDVEETAIGATIVKKQYEEILASQSQNYYPSALKYLANVKSPMQVHALDIKKRHPDAKVVFIGPCLAKKDEADHHAQQSRRRDGIDPVAQGIYRAQQTVGQKKFIMLGHFVRQIDPHGDLLRVFQIEIAGIVNIIAAPEPCTDVFRRRAV